MGPALHVRIRAGHPKRVTVVTFGLLRPEYGGSIRRGPRLWVNCEEVSGGSPLPMGLALHVRIRAGHPQR
eukprot:1575277-Pyramimonas_sp.AAC.1